ncbi:iron-sulfur-binding ferredoxin reductase [Pseudomonas cichorii]|uniref:Iron-sulfur-binding ferredoxin reductase n=1 Tax=Pseudomonas lijiangensis TaxID=2995658 RepID=A0ABX8HP87_9PSED|nr:MULTISPECIES: iron-sulfur-binding ferredoxin reductase [Pseudomonas syringae group]MBX8500825.1 iron-sulfur-binding ferredoxin reductase [Pseudomonas lijiangensis]MBX8504627.1 iron-sulfur-binding ferredoxin reductase [Pseudomonas lijiangensis]MBX8533096.1 iron-sulfur-binding ferredoxin reductase [Pseudomonas cichorii]MBX8543015.1 iron-sulfur-binding ferredoxin reductase [Pseudomonas cichorii]MBX8551528.1 iron-sulfur-binding ferredoxin reductase [Pseudomonas cichorii]
MPEIHVGNRHWPVAEASNLLDALNQAGVAVPYSCRAGSCHACLVRCVQGEPADDKPDALAADKRQQGWRLACQCRVVEDLSVEVFDPVRDGLPAKVSGCDWLSPTVLRLRLEPERPQRYRAGQHQVLWTSSGIARPYSLASLPGEDAFLEFHLDCRLPGAFCDVARQLQTGDAIRLGELRGGALQYDPDWQERPLLLLAAGTGLGPLWGVLREALRQDHQGPIHFLHLARDVAEHYLAGELQALAAEHPGLQVRLVTPDQLPTALDELRLLSRRAMALVCGSPASVETFAKRLYLSGLPRNQLLADVFVTRA